MDSSFEISVELQRQRLGGLLVWGQPKQKVIKILSQQNMPSMVHTCNSRYMRDHRFDVSLRPAPGKKWDPTWKIEQKRTVGVAQVVECLPNELQDTRLWAQILLIFFFSFPLLSA
jgi:hypothetical protein